MAQSSPSSSQGTDVDSKNQRRTRRHVKSGCRTCKIRRVKCDESRPACQRCVSTGRVCDGYGVWGGGGNSYGSRRRLDETSRSPSSITKGIQAPWTASIDSLESSCFDFFRLRTVLKMPGLFESRFWDSIVLQVSLSEPAVFHAAIALASTQRGQVLHDQLRDCTAKKNGDLSWDLDRNKWDHVALQHYNKAIAHLQVHFADRSRRSIQIALTVCIIFTCIELMRGSHTAANIHIDNGIKLLQTLKHQSRIRDDTATPRSSKTMIRTPDLKSVDDHLLETFARMNIQSVLFGFPARYLHVIDEDARPQDRHSIPLLFVSVEEARQYLEVILNGVLHLISDSRSGSISKEDDVAALSTQRMELQESLSEWIEAYETSIPVLLPTLDPKGGMGLALLGVYHMMTEIMLATSPHPNIPWSEMVFDGYTHAFQNLVTRANDLAHFRNIPVHYVIDTKNCQLGGLNFTVDMGLIAPLYYTAIKCRVPSIRREAIDILKSVPHRESMWDGLVVAAVAEKVVHLEEWEFYDELGFLQAEKVLSRASDSPSPDRRSRSLASLPEAYRFEDVQLTMQEGTNNTGKVICRRRKKSSIVSYNSSTEWEIIEEPFECETSYTH